MRPSAPRTLGKTMQFVFITAIVLVALGAAVLSQGAFLRLVQEPLCRSYAQDRGVNIEGAELVQVTIFSSRNPVRPHTCTFRQPGSDIPIEVEFSSADTPYLADTMQVLSMVCTFLCVGLLGLLALLALMLRFGYSLPPLQKPTETPK